MRNSSRIPLPVCFPCALCSFEPIGYPSQLAICSSKIHPRRKPHHMPLARPLRHTGRRDHLATSSAPVRCCHSASVVLFSCRLASPTTAYWICRCRICSGESSAGYASPAGCQRAARARCQCHLRPHEPHHLQPRRQQRPDFGQWIRAHAIDAIDRQSPLDQPLVGLRSASLDNTVWAGHNGRPGISTTTGTASNRTPHASTRHHRRRTITACRAPSSSNGSSNG